MSDPTFRKLLATQVHIEEADCELSADRNLQEATWIELDDSPIMARIGQPRGGLGNSPLGLVLQATAVIYYDGADIDLHPRRLYHFRWTDAAGRVRHAVNVGPPEPMGGSLNHMRIPVQEVPNWPSASQ